jgi:hypothetical protein
MFAHIHDIGQNSRVVIRNLTPDNQPARFRLQGIQLLREGITDAREYRAGETAIDFDPLEARGETESLSRSTQIAPITPGTPEVIVRMLRTAVDETAQPQSTSGQDSLAPRNEVPQAQRITVEAERSQAKMGQSEIKRMDIPVRPEGEAPAFGVAPAGMRPPIYALSQAAICEGAQVFGADPMAIITAPEQWAYAVIVPVGRSDSNRRGRFRVKISLLVHQGCVGIGILRRDESGFAQEVSIAPSSSWREIALVTPNLDEAGPLVVRNHSVSGVSHVQLRILEAELVADEFDRAAPRPSIAPDPGRLPSVRSSTTSLVMRSSSWRRTWQY